AKILNPEHSGQITRTATSAPQPMTLEYASPEQVRGEAVTASTDVYSLGVLLYELLTGHRPYSVEGCTWQEVERIICVEQPEKPSVHCRLASDLDKVVLMALRKEPERRYSSVADFAEDIRRHLQGRPVRARPNTLPYRSRKFLKRNRALITAAAISAVMGVALVMGLGRIGGSGSHAKAKPATKDQRWDHLKFEKVAILG